MKLDRREYLDYMTFGESARPMFCELFGPLVGLENEWRAQGASDDEINMVAFDWDYVDVVGCGGNTGMLDPERSVILEDNDRFTIRTNEFGKREKLCKGFATISLPLEYPVKNMDDWLKLKPKFTYREDRISLDGINHAVKRQKEGAVVIAGIPGGYDLPRTLMGDEEACVCYYEQPELMADILDTAADMAVRVFDRISDVVTVDVLCVHEDMAGKSGPLAGPELIIKFIKPYYRKIWDMLSAKGTRIFSQDSDGNMNPVVDAFLECGINRMFPMEPAAGMDIVELRKKYGERLAFKGGIDKHVLRESKAAIRAELEYKMQPAMKTGGIAFGLDHRIPNGTPLENYRYYVETGREILGLPSLKKGDKGWGRMAF